jgi:hypothetical protein
MLGPWLQPCVCGETCGCGTIKISKEEVITGSYVSGLVSQAALTPYPVQPALLSYNFFAAIKSSKAAAASSGRT